MDLTFRAILKRLTAEELEEIRRECESLLKNVYASTICPNEKRILDEQGRAGLLEAVKQVRNRTGLDLLTSKRVCENYLAERNQAAL